MSVKFRETGVAFRSCAFYFNGACSLGARCYIVVKQIYRVTAVYLISVSVLKQPIYRG